LKTKIIIGLILLLPVFGFSQGEWNNWYFGFHAGVDFNSGNPVALTDCNSWFSTLYYSASVSDSLGSLLFYSDGQYVFNKIHEVMPDGNTLDAQGRQAVFAFKKQGSQHIYYMFTMDAPWSNPQGLRYVIINMTMNGGLGGLQNGWVPISVPGGEEANNALTGIRHSNNKDVWIVTRKWDSTYTYLSYMVTAEGLDTIPVESNSMLKLPSPGIHHIYIIRISPDGTKLLAVYNTFSEYCQFNPTTGQITPLFLFSPEGTGSIGGAEFSADSRYLYVTKPVGNGGELFQYNALKTDSAEFMQSEVYIATYDRSHLMIAPDGKIYGTKENKDYLAVINNPSEQGLACNFQDSAVYLEGNVAYYGLPQFLQTYYVYINGSNKCKGESISFSASIYPQYDSLAWDFGDPASGINNYSNLETPEHTYDTSGQYTVRLIAHHIDNRFDTGWLTVQVYEPPYPSLGVDTTICVGDSVTFDAGTCTDCIFSWDNLTTGQQNIANGQTYKTGEEGVYAVTVTSPESCIGRDTVQLNVVPVALVSVIPPTFSICSGDTTNLLLQCNLPGTTLSWSAIASSPLISGYAGGTGDTINQILVNADTTNHLVTYTITPQVANCTNVSLDYPIPVFPEPDIYFFPDTLSVCNGQLASINLFSHVTGANFSWTATGSSANVSGYTDGTGSYINQLLINSGTDTEYVTYHVTPTSADGCSGTDVDYVVTVLPTVEVTIIPPSTEICSGEITGIDLQCNLPGCSFSWTAVASSPDVTGYSGGSGNAIIQALNNTSQLTQTVTYFIAPSVTGCGADTIEYIVTIHPILPVSISISPSANPVCGGIPVTFIATPINGGSLPGFQWQVNGVNSGGNTSDYTYLPVDGDIVSCVLTSSEDCVTGNPATSNSIIMSIGEQPDVSFSVCFDTITTINAKPFKLKGGIPLGGTYSGPGVDQITGYFNLAMAGLGTKTISYSYTNWYNCSDNEIRNITVINPSSFICGNPLTDIRDNTVYPTVLIGSQCWMAANLTYGNQIPNTTPQRDNCLPEKYTINQTSFYQWDELMRYEDAEQAQGFCPPGWHVPSESDWNTLFANWTNNAFAGAPLKYSGFSGFNALLTGAGLFNRGWEFDAFATFFWSSTSHGPWKAWAHGMNEYNYSVSYYPSYRVNAFSVRCIRD